VNAETGAVAQQIDYDSFGNVMQDTSPGFQPFGFAGGLYDRQTKLVRFGARDYDPEVGRWTARDPLLFDGGQANLFVYVGNDPVNSFDPSGNKTCRAEEAVTFGTCLACAGGVLGVGLGGLTGVAAAAAVIVITGTCIACGGAISIEAECEPDPCPQPPEGCTVTGDARVGCVVDCDLMCMEP
jgi:RHS repeat-associated protein